MRVSAIRSEQPQKYPADPVDPGILGNSVTTTSDLADWTRIAWQGVTFDAPVGWNPLEVSGTRERGAVRLGDLYRTMMQVDWRAVGRLHRVDRVWKRYLKRQLHLTATSDRLVDRPALVSCLRAGGWVDVRVVRLDDGTGSIHALVRSAASRRFVLIRVVLGADDDETNIVEPLLATLRESPRRGPQPWCLYGFGFRVPARSRLDEWHLRPGHLEMTFRCRGLGITWQRIALARRALGDRDVHAWMANHLESRYRRTTWVPKSAAPRDGCAVRRRPGWIGRLCPTSLRTMGRAVTWHAADADQLVVLLVHGRPHKIDAVFTMLCESWRVCEVK